VKILRLLEYGVYALLILFVFTVFVVVYTIISNTIFFLRDEMSIIELVGGKSYFIYGPLVIQGIVYTGCATLLALALFYALPYMIPLESFPPVVSTILTSFFTQFSEYVMFGVLPRSSWVWHLLLWPHGSISTRRLGRGEHHI
jgi:cell division protein FtsX